MIYIIITGMLWAIDGIFRANLTAELNSVTIVLHEHIFGIILLVLLAIFFERHFKFQKVRAAKDYIEIFVLAIVSGFLGTYFFTEAFALSYQTGDFITPVLLQKLQPIFVLALSAIFLKEQITKKSYVSIGVALLGSYLLIVGFNIADVKNLNLEMVTYSILAALFWGSGTILSKNLLSRYNQFSVTVFRFVATALIALMVLPFTVGSFQLDELSTNVVLNIILIAISTGAAAMLFYYSGLKKVPAHKSSIYELAFPITAFIIGLTSLNPYGAAQPFELDKLIGVGLIAISMFFIQKKEPLEIV